MADFNDIFTSWQDVTDVIKTQFLVNLNDLSVVPKKKQFTFLADSIRLNGNGINGLAVTIPFMLRNNRSWTRVPRGGFLPSGSALETATQNFTLVGHGAAAAVSYEDILATDGNPDAMVKAQRMALQGIYDEFPDYKRMLLWAPASGILCRSSGVCVSGVVTVDNTGLWFTHTGDRLKFVQKGWFLAVYSSGLAYKGVVRVIEVDQAANTFLVDADTPTAIADNDVFVKTNISARETNLNRCGPSILDVIDDNNTFQGVNRATAGNGWARALVSGTTNLPTRAKLLAFARKIGNFPVTFCANYTVLEYLYNSLAAGHVLYQPFPAVKDGYSSIEVQNHRVVEDFDVPYDMIVVPDLDNMALYTKGDVKPISKGWERIPGKNEYEYQVIWYGLLGATDCQFMGVLTNVDVTAGS